MHTAFALIKIETSFQLGFVNFIYLYFLLANTSMIAMQ